MHPAGSLVGAAQVELPDPLTGTLSGRLDLETQNPAEPRPGADLPNTRCPLLRQRHWLAPWRHAHRRALVDRRRRVRGSGVNGTVDIRFQPQFGIHAEGQSELLCLPMGANSTFDLYTTDNPSGAVINLGGGVDYDLGGVLKFNGQIQAFCTLHAPHRARPAAGESQPRLGGALPRPPDRRGGPSDEARTR